MRKLFYVSFALILIGLSGCSLYESSLKPNYEEESYIQATRKGEILDGLRTVAVIIATHLNTYNPEIYDKDSELFFVDIYISDDSNNPKRQGLNNEDFSIFMVSNPKFTLYNPQLSQVMEYKENETQEELKISPLEIKSIKKEELPPVAQSLVSRWGHYFLVKFPKQTQEQRNHIRLLITSKTYGTAVLTFGIKALQTYGK